MSWTRKSGIRKVRNAAQFISWFQKNHVFTVYWQTCYPLPGKGIKASTGDTDILLGNREFIRTLADNFDNPEVDRTAAKFAASGKTSLFLAVNGKMAALLAIADQMKPETPQTISRLKKR